MAWVRGRTVLRKVVIPVLVGLAVTLGVNRYANQAPAAPVPEETVEVVVAARDIPARTRLTPEMVATRSFPRSYLHPLMLTDRKAVAGEVTTAPLSKGEPILSSRIAAGRAEHGLAYVIPEGRRAMAIGINEIVGVGGFLQPGDRVDVIALLGPGQGGEERSVLLLQDIPILAVARRTEVKGGLDGPLELKGYSSATVAVTPDEAAVLVLAEEVGLLRLLLRPAAAERNATPVEVTVTNLLQRGRTTIKGR